MEFKLNASARIQRVKAAGPNRGGLLKRLEDRLKEEQAALKQAENEYGKNSTEYKDAKDAVDLTKKAISHNKSAGDSNRSRR